MFLIYSGLGGSQDSAAKACNERGLQDCFGKRLEGWDQCVGSGVGIEGGCILRGTNGNMSFNIIFF